MPVDYSHPLFAFPKAPRLAAVRDDRRKSRQSHEREVREAVKARDKVCRVPFTPHEGPLEMAHLDDKGRGGDHGFRTSTANCVRVCRGHHRGVRSLHSGHLQWSKLTKKGADGPLEFRWVQLARD